MRIKMMNYIINHRMKILLLLNAGVLALFVLGYFIMTEEFLMQRQAIIGQLYRTDEKIAKEVVDSMFLADTSAGNMEQGYIAMQKLGYTDKGYQYLIRALPVNMNLIILSILLITILLLIIILFRKITIDHMKYLLNLDSKISQSIKNKQELLVSDVLSREKNQLESNLREWIHQLLQEEAYSNHRNRQLQDFIENVAHQIRTPISCISISLDMMKEDSGDNDQRIDDCFLQISEIKTMMKRLLQIGSLEAGKIIFERDKLNILEMVHMLVRSVKAGHPASNIQIHYRVKEDLRHTVSIIEGTDKDIQKIDSENAWDYEFFGDYEWLYEAIGNVIGNSLTHTQGSKTVQVKLESYQEFINIIILDDGEGISEEDIPYIFDRFHTRNKGSDVRGEFHAGIGLNLAKLIIEGHYGTIKAHNGAEGGAVFQITLPKYTMKEKVPAVRFL